MCVFQSQVRLRGYLERAVGVDAAPAAFLQLHLRVQVLLVLLHDVGQVGPPAALRVVVLAVAVVVVVVCEVLLARGGWGTERQTDSKSTLSSVTTDSTTFVV